MGENDTQRSIFKSIYLRPKSVDQLALELELSSKTIDNNIAKLRRIVEENENLSWIKNFNSKNLATYTVVKKQDFEIKQLPKIFRWFRHDSTPRIIINLPDPPEGYDRWIVIPIGDIHYGASSCDYEGFQSYLNWIEETPNVIVILNGDLIENANSDSPGASVYKQIFPPQEQKERIIRSLARISHRIIYSVRGNHGNRSVKKCYLDPEKDISTILGVEYFEGQCFADIVCQNYKWDFYSIHGNSSASTPGGRLNILAKKDMFHSAHVSTMGHVHDLQATRDYEIIKSETDLGLTFKKRYKVLCGTFQKYWGDYAEEWALPPNKTGVPKIELYCDGSRNPGDYHVIT